MKKIILIMLLSLILCASLFTQNALSQNDVIHNKNKYLIILPAKIDSVNAYSIGDEACNEIVRAATKLKFYKAIDRFNIMGLQFLYPNNMINDSMAVKLGKTISARDVLKVKVLDFYQKGVPPDLDDVKKEIVLGLVVELFNDEDEEDEKYASNVQTQLHVQIDKLITKTGNTAPFFEVSASHTGGSYEESKAQALKQVHQEAMINLKELVSFY